MPTQAIETLGRNSFGRADRKPWQRKRLIRVGWVTSKAGYSHFALICFVVRHEIFVANRPVLRNPVKSLNPKIRAMKPQELRVPMNCRATDSVGHLDVGRVLPTRGHRVVFGPLALIRAETEAG